MLLRSNAEITSHLNCLCVHQDCVLLFHPAFHEVLVDEFPKASPHIAIIHNKKMIASGNERMADI